MPLKTYLLFSCNQLFWEETYNNSHVIMSECLGIHTLPQHSSIYHITVSTRPPPPLLLHPNLTNCKHHHLMSSGSAPVLLKVSHCSETVTIRNKKRQMPHSISYSYAEEICNEDLNKEPLLEKGRGRKHLFYSMSSITALPTKLKLQTVHHVDVWYPACNWQFFQDVSWKS